MNLINRQDNILIDKTTGHRWQFIRFDWDIMKWDLKQVDESDCPLYNDKNELIISHISEELLKEGFDKNIYQWANQKDKIKPSHYYSRHRSCTEVMLDFSTNEEWISFCELNVIKYLYRYKYKNGIEDLKKAKQYIDMLIGAYNESLQK